MVTIQIPGNKERYSNEKQKFKRILSGLLCAAFIVCQTVPVLATDEYGDPIVTATPVPEEVYHTDYYKQPADTDSIEDGYRGPQIEGESAVLMDMITGSILYSKNADKAQYPASITKIMTALLGSESLKATDKFAMSETAAHGITDTQSSSIYADTGEEFTVEQALMAVMLQSANEMTLAIAEQTSGSVKKFVELMNLKARQLGCTNTHFNNLTVFQMKSITQQQTTWQKSPVQPGSILPSVNTVPTVYYEIPATNKFSETRYLLNHHKMMSGQTYAYDGVFWRQDRLHRRLPEIHLSPLPAGKYVPCLRRHAVHQWCILRYQIPPGLRI